MKYINSRIIYIGFLLLTLGLTYIDKHGRVAAIVYYNSFGLLIWYFLSNKDYLMPVYVFLLMANGYVLAITQGFWIDILGENIFLVGFSEKEFIEAFRIGIVALLGTAWAIKKNKITKISINADNKDSIYFNKIYLYLILFVILLLLFGEMVYIYLNRHHFLETYVYGDILKNMSDKSLIIVKVMLYFDLFIFSCSIIYVTYNIEWRRSIIFWTEVLLFSLIHFAIGNRKFLVIFYMMLFWRYYTQYGIEFINRPSIKLGAGISGILIMGFIAVYRMGKTIDILIALLLLSNEFTFGIISTLYSVKYAAQNLGPPIFLPLLDPLVGWIPSFLLPSKKELVLWESWFESIGGLKYYSPVGGIFLPGQIYLITGGLIGIFIFYYLFSVFLQRNYAKLFSGRKIYIIQGLATSSLILVYSLRNEYWVLVKFIMLWWFIFPTVFYILSDILSMKYNKNRIIRDLY